MNCSFQFLQCTPNDLFDLPVSTIEALTKRHPLHSVKNHSNWALIATEGSFSNPVTVLNANSTSNLLSSNIGPDGDFLIFENTSPIAIDIELTVEES